MIHFGELIWQTKTIMKAAVYAHEIGHISADMANLNSIYFLSSRKLIVNAKVFPLTSQAMESSNVFQCIVNANQSSKYVVLLRSVSIVVVVMVPQVEICYPPIIQSGGKYVLKFSTVR